MSWQYVNPKTFPPIFTEKSFFFLVDIKNKDFIQLVNEKRSHYETENILKSDGLRYREIYKPDRQLKLLLKKINKRYLSKLSYPPFAHCGPKGRSIVTACKGHSKFIHHTSLDIDSFFDKVSRKVTETTLISIGIKKVVVSLICDVAVENNKLPQGFPTSSALSTLAISYVLQDFYSHFNKQDVILSLFADDILISSSDQTLITKAEKFIVERIDTIGLSLNSDKKAMGKKGNKFIWLRLQIHPWTTLPRKKVNILQKDVYTYKTQGILSKDFKPKRKGNLRHQWEQSAKGKVVFARSVTKNKLLDKISKALKTK